MKISHRLGGNICRRHSNKALFSKIYTELLKLNNRKQTAQLKNGPKTLADISQKKTYRRLISMKRCSISYTIRKTQNNEISLHIMNKSALFIIAQM